MILESKEAEPEGRGDKKKKQGKEGGNEGR